VPSLKMSLKVLVRICMDMWGIRYRIKVSSEERFTPSSIADYKASPTASTVVDVKFRALFNFTEEDATNYFVKAVGKYVLQELMIG
jgi:hypothetical protein